MFREVAYKSRGLNEVVAGLDEFVEQVTVLPPAEWDPKIRIEPPQKVQSQVIILITFCILETPQRVLWQTLKTQVNAAFHQCLHCLLRFNQHSGTEIQKPVIP